MHKNELRGLREKDLLRAMEELEETWSETLLRGSDEALEEHTQRTRELEEEYLRRHPDQQMVPDLPIADRFDGDRPKCGPAGHHDEEEKTGSHAELAGGEAGVVDREAENGPDDPNSAYQTSGARSANSAHDADSGQAANGGHGASALGAEGGNRVKGRDDADGPHGADHRRGAQDPSGAQDPRGAEGANSTRGVGGTSDADDLSGVDGVYADRRMHFTDSAR